MSTADVAKEEDDDGKGQTDGEEVARVKDGSQQQKGAQELSEERNKRNRSHFYLKFIKN